MLGHLEDAPIFRPHSKIKMSVKNSGTRVAWSLKKESASLIIENFKEAMDHFDEENVISSEVFLVCNFSMFFSEPENCNTYIIENMGEDSIVSSRCEANPFFSWSTQVRLTCVCLLKVEACQFE